MNCPYCQKEMVKGSIDSRRGDIRWKPQTAKSSESEFYLAFTGLFGGANIEAEYCPTCGKIMIDSRVTHTDQKFPWKDHQD